MQIINFNTHWLYIPDNLANGYDVNLDESSFEKICVPHANKILQTHRGVDFQRHIESFRFVSWYRRHFSLDITCTGKRITVAFQAVATVATVYVNGHYAGKHEGAYTSFSVDITPYVNCDGHDNVIAVQVDSTQRKDLPPEGHQVDYLLFGGIVRDVHLCITDRVYAEWRFFPRRN